MAELANLDLFQGIPPTASTKRAFGLSHWILLSPRNPLASKSWTTFDYTQSSSFFPNIFYWFPIILSVILIPLRAEGPHFHHYPPHFLRWLNKANVCRSACPGGGLNTSALASFPGMWPWDTSPFFVPPSLPIWQMQFKVPFLSMKCFLSAEWEDPFLLWTSTTTVLNPSALCWPESC